MARAILIALVSVGTSLAAAGTAAAQDCMCIQPSWAEASYGGDPEQAWAELQVQSRDALGVAARGLPAAEAPAERGSEPPPSAVEGRAVGPLFSSDGAALSSLAAARPGRGPAPVQEILWCASPDDPRCSPSDRGPEDGSRAFRATPSAMGAKGDRVRVGPASSSAARPRVCLGGPRAGVRGRLERPPRS